MIQLAYCMISYDSAKRIERFHLLNKVTKTRNTIVNIYVWLNLRVNANYHHTQTVFFPLPYMTYYATGQIQNVAFPLTLSCSLLLCLKWYKMDPSAELIIQGTRTFIIGLFIVSTLLFLNSAFWQYLLIVLIYSEVLKKEVGLWYCV